MLELENDVFYCLWLHIILLILLQGSRNRDIQVETQRHTHKEKRKIARLGIELIWREALGPRYDEACSSWEKLGDVHHSQSRAIIFLEKVVLHYYLPTLSVDRAVPSLMSLRILVLNGQNFNTPTPIHPTLHSTVNKKLQLMVKETQEAPQPSEIMGIKVFVCEVLSDLRSFMTAHTDGCPNYGWDRRQRQNVYSLGTLLCLLLDICSCFLLKFAK